MKVRQKEILLLGHLKAEGSLAVIRNRRQRVALKRQRQWDSMEGMAVPSHLIRTVVCVKAAVNEPWQSAAFNPNELIAASFHRLPLFDSSH